MTEGRARLNEHHRSLPVLAGVLAVVVLVAVAAWALDVWPAPRSKIAATPTATPSVSASVVPVDEAARLRAAVAAAFPDGEALSDGDDRYEFVRHKLLAAPFGPVLVSEGQVPDATHVSAGRIDVAYLAPAGAGFTMRRRFPAAIKVGSFGRVGDWRVEDRLAAVPVVIADGGFTGQGYTCGQAVLSELRDSGPVEVAQVPLVYDDAGAVTDGQATTLEGQIVEPGERGFTVRYTGTRSFSEHWSRRGDTFVPDAPTAVPSC